MSEISELFARDPLSYSTQDIALIVAKQREAQAQFELGVKAPTPKAPKSAKTKDLLKDLGLGADDVLGDLGLK